jgi:CRISPR-associated endonuclease/helicase Cas3
MHNLAESILIFDEVQAVPIKCLSMFNAAMNFLSEYCGATIILCTATQPELADADVPIPIRLSEPNEMIPDYEEKYQQFRRTRIVDATSEKHSAETLAQFVLDKATENISVLVIMNTKSAARKLYEELKTQMRSQDGLNEEKLYYLSTNLCPAHRMEKLYEIISKLEKNKEQKEKERVVCVSTQLIEAGVDVSFDSVIRSLAGLDSIAQAAGRCNRHGENEIKDVYVIRSLDENLSRLPDIEYGQITTERLLREYNENPEFFDNDLLSPRAISVYYSYYFHEQKEKMDYIITKKLSGLAEDVTLTDLLTYNQVGRNAYKGRCKSEPPYYLPQAFSTAGDLFQVIDSDTTSVIVPYGEGENIIEELHRVTYPPAIFKLTRKAQQFSVNLFAYEREQLATGVYQINETGIFALDKPCYSADYGVTLPSGDTLLLYY